METFVKILVLKNEVEAQMMDLALTELAIPHGIRSYHDSAYDGLFQMQRGWGHIEAPACHADEIKAIYKELTAAGADGCTESPS
jgi:hypothetical protein